MTRPAGRRLGYGRLWPVRRRVDRVLEPARLAVARRPASGPPVVVVSPHLDDAVLSCGQLLAASREAIVLTVFSAGPDEGAPLTDWDRACGFVSASHFSKCYRERFLRTPRGERQRPL